MKEVLLLYSAMAKDTTETTPNVPSLHVLRVLRGENLCLSVSHLWLTFTQTARKQSTLCELTSSMMRTCSSVTPASRCSLGTNTRAR